MILCCKVSVRMTTTLLTRSSPPRCIIYVCFNGPVQSWPPASDASRSNKNDHHCFFDVCLTCLVGLLCRYSSANDRARIDQLLRKLKGSGFLPEAAPDAETLAREADDRLFKCILLDPNHVLRKHFPETRPTNCNLRPRAHEFKLPLKDDRNYVPSLLFKDMY